MSDTSSSEFDGTDREASSGSRTLVWCLGVFGFYVGVFVLLYLDSFVFKTHFVGSFRDARAQVARQIAMAAF